MKMMKNKYVSCPFASVDKVLPISKKRKMKSRGNCGDDESPITHIDNILCEILSRLHVKSLLQFKSVCKHWRSLIEHDHFIYLHSTRSKTQPRLLFFSLVERQKVLMSAELFEDRADVHTIEPITYYQRVRGPVNGLFCFVRSKPFVVRIHNLSTHEVSPWIKIKIDNKEKHGIGFQYWRPYIEFGFDPATKEHKVICAYTVRKYLPAELKVLSSVAKFKVLTVGHNIWRKIDAVPPYQLIGKSVHVNGTIYWRHVEHYECDSTSEKPKVIVAFDVGREKFRVIPIPNFILAQHPPLECDPFVDQSSLVNLLEVDGSLGLLHMMGEDIAKLWIYEDDHNKEKNTTINTSNNWIEELIALPLIGSSTSRVHFKAIAGTDQMIIHSSCKWLDRVYLYDRKKKTSMVIEIGGISSARSLLPPCRYSVKTFVESLWPVQKQLPNYSEPLPGK